jgi:hypothetical protein
MKNILIHPHSPFNATDGGNVVQYHLAQILEDRGMTVRMYPSFGYFPDCPIFNKFYDNANDFPIDDNCVVIYCEGIQGNPLNAKYVVRWMLSELGQNVPYDRVNDWGKDELVYHFNTEIKFKNHPEKVGNIYKTLTTIYASPQIQNRQNPNRSGWCHTFRKTHIHKTDWIPFLHPNDSFQFHHSHDDTTMDGAIDIFNKHQYFVSYDPLTFLYCIAPLCGCVSIVLPIQGKSKIEWLYMTGFAEYMQAKQIDYIYGIAYGMEEFEWAKNTVHAFKEQFDDILSFYKEKHITQLIHDIHNFESAENTIQNVYYS